MKDTRRRALNLGELLIAGEILSVEIIFRFLNLVGSDRIGRILCYESLRVTCRYGTHHSVFLQSHGRRGGRLVSLFSRSLTFYALLAEPIRC
jgi:hypothetical protein